MIFAGNHTLLKILNQHKVGRGYRGEVTVYSEAFSWKLPAVLFLKRQTKKYYRNGNELHTLSNTCKPYILQMGLQAARLPCNGTWNRTGVNQLLGVSAQEPHQGWCPAAATAGQLERQEGEHAKARGASSTAPALRETESRVICDIYGRMYCRHWNNLRTVL